MTTQQRAYKLKKGKTEEMDNITHISMEAEANLFPQLAK